MRRPAGGSRFATVNAESRTAPTQVPTQRATGHQLEQMLAGVAMTHSIYAAAKLGIADLLTDGPRNTEELASLAAVDPPSLYRLLRALASVGVFTEIAPATFALTSIAERLKTDAPDSLRAWAIFTGEIAVRCWGELMHSLRTGHPAFESVFGRSIFEHLEAHPDDAAVFDHHQAQGGLALHAAVAAAYDFGAIHTIVDVGGGNGSLAAAILKRHPDVRAAIFDLPHVIERARAAAAAHPTQSSRCDYIGGSFFDCIPPGADAYMLSRVLHDWDDNRAATILTNCRRAMHAGARLLVIERIVPHGNEPHESKFIDLNMLIITGGRERTEHEYRALFERSGLQLAQITDTRSQVSVLEVIPREDPSSASAPQ
jgi:O-methyltransferase domain/Dimerisation domain